MLTWPQGTRPRVMAGKVRLKIHWKAKDLDFKAKAIDLGFKTKAKVKAKSFGLKAKANAEA